MLGELASDRGVTLAEVTVVLLVVSVLAGVAAPSAKRAIDRAKLARVVTDESAIKTAITNFLSDFTAFTPFTSNGTTTGSVTVETIVSDGDISRDTCSGTSCASWQALVTNNTATGTVDFIERQLVTNTPEGGATGYATGSPGWRGAYLNAPIDPDPWGNRYAVNVKFLRTDTTKDVIVLSAGPDEVIDTAYDKDGITPGGDDIISVVRRDVGLTTP